MQKEKSEKLFQKALQLFPGGVNSPVRAFGSVEGSPLFIERGDACYIWDADGNKFIDFCCSWGPLILGHNNIKVRNKIEEVLVKGTSFGAPTLLENQLAELILNNNKYLDKIRFVSSGTEATMSAIRMARGYTNRDKIIKFEGCYHGHTDALLVKAGSGLATFGTSSSAGVPDAYVKETIVLPLNNKNAVLTAVEKYKGNIACIILEPIPANNGLLLQDKNFLQFLREICTKEAILLFFDEVISGFRVGFEGAAGYYNIEPDIVAYGKIIGGGLPVGAYGAKGNIMDCIAPLGNVYQAGTLSGNPVAMAAGIAQLTECLKEGFYESQQERTEFFTNIISKHITQNQYKINIFSIGSIFWLSLAEKETIRAASDIDDSKMLIFKKLYSELLEQGIYFGPSGYEVGFISAAHSKEVLEIAANKICAALDKIF